MAYADDTVDELTTERFPIVSLCHFQTLDKKATVPEAYASGMWNIFLN
jgi:hypothetical protein